MPIITLQRDRFCSFIGRLISVKQMAKKLPWLGLDIEETGLDYVKVEFNPNRMDFSSHAGIARAFRGLMGWETGIPNYVTQEGETVLNVDSSVAEVRPYVLATIVRDIELDDNSIGELMEMQEDLHWGVGRNRKKASIGVHSLEKVHPPFIYTTGDPENVRFVPLDKTEEMSMKEILEIHEKGIVYRQTVDWASKYPVILDSKKRVLSFPPIINGELTKVSSQTKALFIEVTGTNQNSIAKALNILVTALADMGGTIQSVKVKYKDQLFVSPNLKPQRMKLRVEYACKLLGLNLSDAQTARCLRKSRLGVNSLNKGLLEVLVPAYRIDILHEVDLVEEVALGYGYFKLKPSKPPTLTTGAQEWANKMANYVRQIMIGLGFTEVLNFILTNETVHYKKMRKNPRKIIKLANPVSTECSIVRDSLLSGLMKNLSVNKHEIYPQQIFEVSDVVRIQRRTETSYERRLHVAAVSCHPTVNFTKTKSQVESLLANLGLKDWVIRETRHPSYFEGRKAAIYVQTKRMGTLGEIHPQVLNNFQLENPTGAFEIDLEGI